MTRLATVNSTAPLEVRERSSATPVPARLITGSGYTPAAGDRVVITFAGGVCYILGGA